MNKPALRKTDRWTWETSDFQWTIKKVDGLYWIRQYGVDLAGWPTLDDAKSEIEMMRA